jgi:hypothetical protein
VPNNRVAADGIEVIGEVRRLLAAEHDRYAAQSIGEGGSCKSSVEQLKLS